LAIERLHKTIEMFQELSRVDPTNTESPYDIANTRFSVGMAYLSLNEPENAMTSFRTADEEFKEVLATNPDNIYAQRMSALNREATAKAHLKLARQGAEAENGRKALELFVSALQTFQRLKSEG